MQARPEGRTAPILPVSIPDPYKVLQVDPEAEHEVIAAAYKRLARLYHPDVSANPDSVARMVSINQAWEMLRDPVRRAAVDRARVRAAATSARVAAADGRVHAARPSTPGSWGPSAAGRPTDDPQEWPFPGMQDPMAGSFTVPPPRPAQASTAAGAAGSSPDRGYGTRGMGTGAAGPPPGRPSGSIVTFGRYEGWTLGEIARTDLEYLEWLSRMPIGRTWHPEIDDLLRKHGRRTTTDEAAKPRRGLFRRR